MPLQACFCHSNGNIGSVLLADDMAEGSSHLVCYSKMANASVVRNSSWFQSAALVSVCDPRNLQGPGLGQHRAGAAELRDSSEPCTRRERVVCDGTAAAPPAATPRGSRGRDWEGIGGIREQT